MSNDTSNMPAVLSLKGQADRRLRAGHLWIYSNEVDVAASPLKNFQPGEQVQVKSASGKSMGICLLYTSDAADE